MKVFIVHAHPEPKSFNGALTDTAGNYLAENSDEVIVSDLYKMGWNARSDRSNFATTSDPEYFKQQKEEAFATENDGFAEEVKAEQEKLFWCDILIFQFPMWWYGMPAILKGWVDRVLAMGATYGGGYWYDQGKFKGRKAMVSMTVGGPETMYSPTGIGGDMNQLLFPIQRGIFSFTGFDVLPPFLVWQPSRIGDKARKEYLAGYRRRLFELNTTEPIPFPKLQDYDPFTFMLKDESEGVKV